MERASPQLDTTLSSFYKWCAANLDSVERSEFHRNDKQYSIPASSLNIVYAMDMGYGTMELHNTATTDVGYDVREGFAETYDATSNVLTVCWTNVAKDTCGGPLLAYWRFLHHVRHELGDKTYLQRTDAPIELDWYMIKVFIIHNTFMDGFAGLAGFTPLTKDSFEDIRQRLLGEEGAVSCEAVEPGLHVTRMEVYFDRAFYGRMSALIALGGIVVHTIE
jgi:hypothetical protein